MQLNRRWPQLIRSEAAEGASQYKVMWETAAPKKGEAKNGWSCRLESKQFEF